MEGITSLHSKLDQSQNKVVRQPETVGVVLTEDKVREMINEAKNEVLEKARKESIDEINKQVQMDKISLITVFGIFASIISFLTIEFQFLKTISGFSGLLEILGFSFVLFALLFGFNIALDYLVKTRLDKEAPWPNMYFCFFVMILLFSGVVAIWLGHIVYTLG